ncbi:hypothetical protein PAMA_010096 [Pampus argenteus]
MKGLYQGLLVLLLLWTLLVVADAAGGVSSDRGGAGRSQRRGGGSGGGGGGGAEKRRRFHRIQHGQCSYTFILPEFDGCQGAGPMSHTEQYGGSRGGASVVQRDSPPMDGELSAQKLQHLESTMENNTQWLQKRSKFGVVALDEWQLVSLSRGAESDFPPVVVTNYNSSICGLSDSATAQQATRGNLEEEEEEQVEEGAGGGWWRRGLVDNE